MSDDAKKMQEAVDFYLEKSKVKSNGVREVPKGAFVEAIKKHGISEEDYKTLQDAIDFETTAAARVALHDTNEKIKAASKEDLKSEEFRKGLSSTVRLPTFGGATEVECQAERHSRIPFRGEGDGPDVKIDYGRFRTTINTKGRIYKDLHEEASSLIKKSLGIK